MPINGEGEEYITDMKLAQSYAFTNREVMAKIIFDKFFGIKLKDTPSVRSTHNYIDFKDKILVFL